MTTLELSEAGLEGPANEMAIGHRVGLPEILVFSISRLRVRKRPVDERKPAEPGMIDARARFRHA